MQDKLITAFLETLLAESATDEMMTRCRKPAVKALCKALPEVFGSELPNIRLSNREYPTGTKVSIITLFLRRQCIRRLCTQAYGVTGEGLKHLLMRPMDQIAENREYRIESKAAAKLAPENHRIIEAEDHKDLPGRLSSKYTTEFLAIKCAPRLLELKLYPDAKELTGAPRTHLILK